MRGAPHVEFSTTNSEDQFLNLLRRLSIKAPLILWRKMKAAATPTFGAIRVYGLEGTIVGPKI
jgi:hypothetical protein